jgi:hypothetical protein
LFQSQHIATQGKSSNYQSEENMPLEEIVTTIASALVAAILPRIIKQAEKGIKSMDSVPWLSWTLAGLVGGALGGIASGLLGLLALGLGSFGNWAVYGAALGLLQWFVLGDYRPVSAWWPLVTTTGWMFAAVGEALGGLVFAFILAGVMVGLFQFFFLRKYTNAGVWIIGNVLAWPVAGATGYLVGTFITPTVGLEWAWVVSWAEVGMLGAIILIMPLSRLKRK